MTDAERLIERLLARDRDFGRRSDEMPALNNPDGPEATALIQQQADRIAALEGALRGVIDTADSFCDCSGDEVAAQVKIRARAVLGETGSAEGRG